MPPQEFSITSVLHQDRLQAVADLEILDTPTEAAFEEAVQLAAMICGTPIALVTILDGERQWFKAKLGITITETPVRDAFCAHAIEQDDLFIVPDAELDPRFQHNPLVTGEPRIRFYAGMPLQTPSGFAAGTICVIDTVPRELSPQQRSALDMLARQVATQFELRDKIQKLDQALKAKDLAESQLKKANQLLLELAVTDDLTGLHNRRFFDDHLEIEFALALRHKFPLSILLFDIDDFKAINDNFGHEEGDNILRQVAKALGRGARTSDIVARYGGEEFAVVLSNTTAESALALAERIRSMVQSAFSRQLPVTVSVGVSSISSFTPDFTSLVRAADDALYQAKATGKNRVVIAP